MAGLPNAAGAKTLHGVHSLLQVASEDTSGETVDGVVGTAKDLVHAAELGDLHDWTEDLGGR